MSIRLGLPLLLVAALAFTPPAGANDAPRARVSTPEAATFGERFSVSGTLSARRAALLSTS